MKLLIKKIMPAMLLTLCLSGLLACASRTVEKRGAHSDVGAKTFAVALEKPGTVVVLDVRTAAEYAEGHLPGALLIDVNTDTFTTAARRLIPLERVVAVYCRSGRRSKRAAELLAKEGYVALNLKGGITAWQQEGRPIER